MIVQAAGEVGLIPLTSKPDAPLSEPWNAMMEAGLTVRHVLLPDVDSLLGTTNIFSCKGAFIAAMKTSQIPKGGNSAFSPGLQSKL